MDKMKIYNHMPVWAQNAACCYEGYRIKRTRYGKDFWRLLSEYQSRNDWTYEQLCEYRDAKLRKMIKHCYETVPYYTKLFHEGGINYRSIKTIDDLKVLPILTKQMAKDNFDDLLSTAIPAKDMISAHTSGTTGSGFIFKTTREAICEQWAVWWRYRINLGIKYGTWSAVFGGQVVVPIKNMKPPYYRLITPNKQLYFSIYHMNDNTLSSYISAINQYKIEWIHGFPSAINLLAEYIIKNQKAVLHEIKFVTTAGENVFGFMNEKIYNAFGVYPFQHYGLSETVANFSQNKNHLMKVNEDYAAVEFIEGTGNSKIFNIIGTDLSNYAMSLIRYDTNDVCFVTESKDGRYIESLDGRKEDYIVLPDGTKIGRLHHIFKDITNVIEAQIIQKEKGSIIYRIVKGRDYTKIDENKIIHETISRVGNIKMNFEYVDKIPRTANGKLRFVVSEIAGINF